MIDARSILELFARKGDITYDGEGITQLEHAWQCGQLARKAGASPALQLASWLHDVGHLMTDLQGSPTISGIDDAHEISGAAALHRIWGSTVSEPVRLHVDAKRYLVGSRPDYLKTLSPDSVRSLHLQGGPFSQEQCEEFEAHPLYREALQVRSWDDTGKMRGWFVAERQQAIDELEELMTRVSG